MNNEQDELLDDPELVQLLANVISGSRPNNKPFYEPEEDLDPEALAMLVAGIETEKLCPACAGRGFHRLACDIESCEVCDGAGVVPI